MESLEQGLLFPELDPFKTKIKDLDYIDLSTLKNVGDQRKNTYCKLPKDKYILFKSGGINPYKQELGNCFPYVFNKVTKHVLNVRVEKFKTYPKISITESVDGKPVGFYLMMHRIVSEAFIENDMPDIKTVVDHKYGDKHDYRPEQLRWVTSSENSKGVVRNRSMNEYELFAMGQIKNNETN